MAWSSPVGLVLAFGIIASSAQTLSCQQLRALELGFQKPSLAPQVGSQPSALSLTAKSVGGAISGSVVAGAVGLLVDAVYCNQNHRNEQGTLFGPCYLYAGGGLATGWFGGAGVGATVGAARLAQKRGCPRGAALMRAFGGAVLGVAPGLMIVAQRSGNYPPSRSVILFGTPLLAGIGATAAVIGCHAP
jgi:hypothetical protein